MTNVLSIFFRPRTIPAVGVIFAEPRVMGQTIQRKHVHRFYRHVKKRSLSKIWGQGLPTVKELLFALRNIQPWSIYYLKKSWTILNRFRSWIGQRMYNKLPRALKKLVKIVVRFEARMEKKLICLRPRMKRRYGQLVYPEGLTFNAIKDKKTEFIDFVINGDAEDEKVEFIQDCFDDMDRPKFGYRVMVRLKDNEPCDINFENSDEDTCTSQLESDSKGRNGTDTKYLSQFAQSRQTGEGFSSAAPVDCRLQSC